MKIKEYAVWEVLLLYYGTYLKSRKNQYIKSLDILQLTLF